MFLYTERSESIELLRIMFTKMYLCRLKIEKLLINRSILLGTENIQNHLKLSPKLLFSFS